MKNRHLCGLACIGVLTAAGAAVGAREIAPRGVEEILARWESVTNGNEGMRVKALFHWLRRVV